MAFAIPKLQALLLFILLLSVAPLQAGMTVVEHWLNQLIYVPLYSHIYADERYKDKPFALTATLSIRNTDLKHAMTLETVDYFDSKGTLLHRYLDGPVAIAPLASTRFIVRENDKGGSGAKFIVQWHSKTPISAPIVESIMIGTKMQQGISFISRGRVIEGTLSK
jgi:hypothetical protein